MDILLKKRQTQIKYLKQFLQHLNNDHKKTVLDEKSLKSAHMYCKVQKLSGQVSGPLLEKWIISKYSMQPINSSLCCGDAEFNGNLIEIKISLGGKQNEKFNYVQIRPHQNISYYLLTAYLLNPSNVNNMGELFIFRVPSKDMKTILLRYGSYAHGTKLKNGPITIADLADETNKKEYAIRPKYKDSCWNHLLRFRILYI